MSYAEFLAGKLAAAPRAGVTIDPSDLHDSLYPWQAEIVRWACDVGRAAIWADTGLGKARRRSPGSDRSCTRPSASAAAPSALS